MNVFGIGFFLAMENSSDSHRERNVIRTIYLVLGFLLLGWLSSGQLFAQTTERLPCDSCRFQVNSLDEPFKLSGNWLFTRDDNPRNNDIDLDTGAWTVVKAPGPWKKAYDDGKKFTVGWYRANFEFAPGLVGQEVVLLADAYMSRVTVFVDGQEVFRRPGNINIERYYSVQPIPVRFTITHPRHVVAIRVETPMMLGVYQLPFELHKYDVRDTSFAWFQFWGGELRAIVAAVALVFGLFFLLVYVKTKYPLYLVAFLGTVVITPFFAAPSDIFLKVFNPEPMLYLHYSGLYGSMFFCLFCQFFYKFTPRFNWIYGGIFAAAALRMGSMAVVPNVELFQKFRPVYLIMTIIPIITAIYTTWQGVRLKQPGSLFLFLAMVFFVGTATNDLLLALGKIESVAMLFTGVGVFTGAMLYVASQIFANTFTQNKQLAHSLRGMNEELENLVAQRTLQLKKKQQDIEAMLHNLPQGVLVVTADGSIHGEYSVYLETLFETREIAGRQMMELIFSSTNLGADILAQVDAVVGACIGEDRMNFDFNAHLMVRELDKQMPSGLSKSLELVWSPICAEDGTCERLMICMRDVTRLKALVAEADKQKRELEMIGQILAVNQDKFHEFVDSASGFIRENETLIKNTHNKDQGVIGLLFRNMHTIKGNARTYGLRLLTNTVHEAEQTYDDMRKNEHVQWDQAKLLYQLQQAYDALQEYARLNEGKLGRRGPGRRGSVDKFLMVQREQVHEMLTHMESVDASNPSLLGDVFRRIRNMLRLIGTEQMVVMLAGVIDSLPSLAQELGKEPPQVSVIDNGIVVKTQMADLLRNVFMHLLRNSMDHGVESAQQRLDRGKPAAGHIQLELSLADGQLWMRLRDDGKGLALGVIRRKAIEKGIISEEQDMPAQELAQLIFASGFSTAEKVTEVSGRGVGMDAVKGFLEREGGSIALRLTQEPSLTESTPFETVISLPDKFAVQSV